MLAKEQLGNKCLEMVCFVIFVEWKKRYIT